MKNPYEVLGLSKDANQDQIKQAYRKIAHQFHPDKNPNDPSAEEKFKEAGIAYQHLSRQKTDKTSENFGTNASPRPNPKIKSQEPQSSQSVGDIFSEVFGDFLGRKKKSDERRGQDKKLKLNIDLKMAVLGGERKIDIPKIKVCQDCLGRGFPPTAIPEICGACAGRGKIQVQQGLFSIKQVCNYCSGTGNIVTTPCETCAGNGNLEFSTALVVQIPPGADSGTILRYKGEGYAGLRGGLPGDLRVVLSVRDDPIFARDSQNITLIVPISIIDACLGCEFLVPTLEGKMKINIPAGTQSGAKFVFPGLGAPELPNGGNRGDQIVAVQVETPRDLSEDQKELLTSFGNRLKPKNQPEIRRFKRHSGTLTAEDYVD